jgi:hypothetical protein
MKIRRDVKSVRHGRFSLYVFLGHMHAFYKSLESQIAALVSQKGYWIQIRTA